MNDCYPLPEWYPQSATVLVWPHRYSDWSYMLDEINLTYINLVRAISQYQNVIVIHYNEGHKSAILKLCIEQNCDTHRLIFINIETNDTWVRDYSAQILFGPSGHQYIDYEFNGWGEQYPSRLDNLFAEKFFEYIKQNNCEYLRTSLVIEGGNLEFDSQANLLTNIACIKRNNLNKPLSDDTILHQLKETFSLKNILAIDIPALKGDDTGGHVDTVARFISDKTIVYCDTDNENNPNYACLLLLKEQLREINNKHNNFYTLTPIPLPEKPIFNDEGDILPASYVNFLFLNDAIIVPLHEDKHDHLAIDCFKKACPERKIIGINANSLIKQYGSLHCATAHIPENII